MSFMKTNVKKKGGRGSTLQKCSRLPLVLAAFQACVVTDNPPRFLFRLSTGNMLYAG